MRIITVYTTGPSCQGCKNTKRWLGSRGIIYREVNITENPEDAAAIRALGYTQAPVVIVSTGDPETGIHWTGFDPTSLAKYTLEAA